MARLLRTNQLDATPSPSVFHVVGEIDERPILNSFCGSITFFLSCYASSRPVLSLEIVQESLR